MPICNTDNFISQLQTKINTIAGDSCPWCQVSGSEISNTSAIKTDGTLWTWGNNQYGQLGELTTVSRRSPGTVAGGGTNWCQVSNGFNHTIAIKTDGTLWTWGSNGQGRLGDGTTVSRSSPVTIAGGGTTWCQVSSTGTRNIALKTDGTIWTWGNNNNGELGDGTAVGRSSPGTIWGSYTTWCKVSISTNHSAAIKTDGTLWTWGYNGSSGYLGDGTTLNRCSPGTVAGSGTTWCQISAGSGNTAAIKIDGTLWTWGNNGQGRLGDGTTVDRSSPGTVAGGGTTWCQVSSMTSRRTSSIKCDGTLWTWGFNCCGRLGDGTTVDRSSPGTVAGAGTNWCQVSNGCNSTTAIKTDGTLWTWGNNLSGVIGDGTIVNRCSPGSVAIAPVASAEDFLLYAEAIAQVTDNRKVSIASSSSLPDPLGNGIPTGQMVFLEDRLIPVIANGHDWDGLDGRALVTGPKYAVFSWGLSSFGPLGDDAGANRSSPGTIWGSYTTWCQVSAGNFQSAAVKTDGTLWTWGYGTCGRLGSGTTTSRRSPGTVAGGGTTWCQVSVGCRNVASIKTDGTLWTWGDNTNGSLGDGTTVSKSSPGTIAGGGTTWRQVSSKRNRMSSIKTDGTLWTWGSNSFGALGDGTTVSRRSPGTVWGSYTTWCQVSVGNDHTAAIKCDGTLWTWGVGGLGALGDGTTVSRRSPGTVAGGGTTWCQISAGDCFTAAIKNDGTLWTWGRNYCGPLGDGTTVDRCSPGTVAGGGTTWCCISFSDAPFALSVKTDGTIWSWGLNSNGQLGDGTAINKSSPGTVAGSGTTWCQVSSGWCHGLAIRSL